jgi:hypothetical protein
MLRAWDMASGIPGLKAVTVESQNNAQRRRILPQHLAQLVPPSHSHSPRSAAAPRGVLSKVLAGGGNAALTVARPVNSAMLAASPNTQLLTLFTITSYYAAIAEKVPAQPTNS